jgi:hypothetical protein
MSPCCIEQQELATTSNKNERQEILDKLESDAAELKNGIKQKRLDLIGHIAKDRQHNWLCKISPYFDKCRNMRIEAGEIKPN